jgi:hypothetical protein
MTATYVVRTYEMGNVQCSEPTALELLRRGGARLVSGDRDRLLAVAKTQDKHLRTGLGPEEPKT